MVSFTDTYVIIFYASLRHMQYCYIDTVLVEDQFDLIL